MDVPNVELDDLNLMEKSQDSKNPLNEDLQTI